MSQQLVEPFDMDVFALELASVLLGDKTVRKHSMEATHRHHNLTKFNLVVSICQFLILVLEVPFTTADATLSSTKPPHSSERLWIDVCRGNLWHPKQRSLQWKLENLW